MRWKNKNFIVIGDEKGLLISLSFLERQSKVKKTVMLFAFWTSENTSINGFASITQN
jgi:hypothetical protein